MAKDQHGAVQTAVEVAPAPDENQNQPVDAPAPAEAPTTPETTETPAETETALKVEVEVIPEPSEMVKKLISSVAGVANTARATRQNVWNALKAEGQEMSTPMRMFLHELANSTDFVEKLGNESVLVLSGQRDPRSFLENID